MIMEMLIRAEVQVHELVNTSIPEFENKFVVRVRFLDDAWIMVTPIRDKSYEARKDMDDFIRKNRYTLPEYVLP
jgi:hypothetical protein